MPLHKKNICKYMKKLYDLHLIGAYDGNISFKPKNKNIIYITPADVPKYSLKTKMINEIKIINMNDLKLNKRKLDKLNKSLQLNIESNTRICYRNKSNNKFKPTGEKSLHIKVINNLHKQFNKNIVVIHCHPPNILAYMGLEMNNYTELSTIKNLFPELPNFIKIGSNVEHFTAKTEKLAIAVEMKLNESYNIVGLHNHGVVCYAETFERCINIISTLDFYCCIALKYLSSNSNRIILTDYIDKELELFEEVLNLDIDRTDNDDKEQNKNNKTIMLF